MKVFKYLILYFIFLPTFAYADVIVRYYQESSPNILFNTKEEACKHGNDSLTFIRATDGGSCYYNNKKPPTTDVTNVGYYKKKIVDYTCPSATEKGLKVPSNAGSYVCESQCQYMLIGCVDIPEEPGQTCTAISTGKVCSASTNPNTGNTSPSPSTSNPGANSNNDGSQTSTNSADSTSTNTSTSTSTSNTTTTNNTTNNTSTSTTTTTTTNNTTTTTKTVIDLSSLENTINNAAKKIIDAIKGNKDQDGSDTGSEDGDIDGTDLTETNKKLSDIKKSIDDGSEWAKKGEDDVLPTGEEIAIPERILEKKSFTENMFGTTAQCPANKTLSMSLLGAKSFSYTFDFSQWCYYLGLLGQLILIVAYLQGAYIITRNS